MSTFLWALVWLGGTAAITGFSVIRHAPALEQAMLEEVRRAVDPLGEPPVTISIEDHAVTLAGNVPDADRRDALLDAAAAAAGIRNVTDRLVVREPLPEGIGTAVGEESGGDTDDGSASPDGADSPPRLTDVTDRTASPSDEARSPAATDLSDDDTTPPAGTADADRPGDARPDDVPPPTAATPALPSLRFNITDGVLTVDGELSPTDDPSTLIEAAMDSFELDFVSNAVESRDGVADADWLAPLVALLPTLGRLDAPGVEVSERRVTLRGSAADSVTRDEIIEATLERLGDYSLVERIVVRESPAASVATGATPPPEDARGETGTSEERSGGETRNETVAAASTDVANDTSAVSDDASTEAAPADDVPTDDPPDEGDPAEDTPVDEREDGDGTNGDDADDAGGESGDPQAGTDRVSLLAELEALPSLRILFRSGSDRLTEESLDTLDTIAEVLGRHPEVPITIGGHTDAAGGTTVNLQLSQLRANAVREYLVTRDVRRERLIARGYGESLPIADNTTAEGRATNRRIEFTY